MYSANAADLCKQTNILSSPANTAASAQKPGSTATIAKKCIHHKRNMALIYFRNGLQTNSNVNFDFRGNKIMRSVTIAQR